MDLKTIDARTTVFQAKMGNGCIRALTLKTIRNIIEARMTGFFATRIRQGAYSTVIADATTTVFQAKMGNRYIRTLTLKTIMNIIDATMTFFCKKN